MTILSKKLSKNQIDVIFSRWYNGETVDSLFKNLGIQRTPNLSFAKHFPPIPSVAKCPYCSKKLHAFRSDQEYFKKTQNPYNISTAHCLSCGHDTKKITCKCTGCELKKKEEERRHELEKAKQIDRRKIDLEMLYRKIKPIKFEEIDLIKLIYLYALCHQSTCEDVTLISPPSLNESSLTLTNEWDLEVIQALLTYIAPFSEDEILLKFNEDGSVSGICQKIFYRIKLHEIEETDFLESLLNHIKNRIINASLNIRFELAELLERMMITECIAYLEYMRKDFNLPSATGPKTNALFKKLIQNWRIDQIYTIIWGRCKDALAYKVQNGLPSYIASNLVIGMIDKYVDKLHVNKWEVKNYYRGASKKQSALSYALFNKILELSGSGIEYNLQDVITKLNSFENRKDEFSYSTE